MNSFFAAAIVINSIDNQCIHMRYVMAYWLCNRIQAVFIISGNSHTAVRAMLNNDIVVNSVRKRMRASTARERNIHGLHPFECIWEVPEHIIAQRALKYNSIKGERYA